MSWMRLSTKLSMSELHACSHSREHGILLTRLHALFDTWKRGGRARTEQRGWKCGAVCQANQSERGLRSREKEEVGTASRLSPSFCFRCPFYLGCA